MVFMTGADENLALAALDRGLELAHHQGMVSNQAFRHLRLTSDDALEQGDPACEPEDDHRYVKHRPPPGETFGIVLRRQGTSAAAPVTDVSHSCDTSA